MNDKLRINICNKLKQPCVRDSFVHAIILVLVLVVVILFSIYLLSEKQEHTTPHVIVYNSDGNELAKFEGEYTVINRDSNIVIKDDNGQYITLYGDFNVISYFP